MGFTFLEVVAAALMGRSWEAALTSHPGDTSRATPVRSLPALRSSILLASKADSVLTRAAAWPYLLLLHDIQNKQRLRLLYPLPYTGLQKGAVLVLDWGGGTCTPWAPEMMVNHLAQAMSFSQALTCLV